MFTDESSTDFIDFKNNYKTKGAIPKNISSSKASTKSFEQKQSNTKSESPTKTETTKSYNFRLSRSKYANLIDQTDIKWWTDLQSKRLTSGKDDLTQSTTAETTAEFGNKPNDPISQKLLSHTPICCPISDCKLCFLPTDLVLHFLGYHRKPIRRVCENERLVITLKPFELNVDEVNCIGLLSYAGDKRTAGTTSSANNLWLSQNLKLYKQFLPLSNDYPIFLLASIVPMDIFINSKVEMETLGYKSLCASMLVLWLAGAQSNANIFYTTIAFNEQLSNSNSGIYSVRELAKPQCPYEFCNKDCNYFRLTFKELHALLRDDKLLQIELILQENFENAK